MSQPADVYRRLQQRLDELPVGYPATESGVELRILRRLFTPEEAEVALVLSAIPESVETIQRRLPGHDRGRARADARSDGRQGSHLRRPRLPAAGRSGTREPRSWSGCTRPRSTG